MPPIGRQNVAVPAYARAGAGRARDARVPAVAPELSERVREWQSSGRTEEFRDRRDPRLRAPRDRPAAAAPARLPLELLRLARAARARARPRRARLRLPRLRALRQTARPRLLARLAGRPGPAPRPRAPRPPGGVRGRPRHGHLGDHRAAGARHRGPAGLRARRGPALQRQHDPRAGDPHAGAAPAAQPAGPAGGAAQQRGDVPAHVRRPLLRRASAQRGGGRGPVGARSATAAAARSATSSSTTWASAPG